MLLSFILQERNESSNSNRSLMALLRHNNRNDNSNPKIHNNPILTHFDLRAKAFNRNPSTGSYQRLLHAPDNVWRSRCSLPNLSHPHLETIVIKCCSEPRRSRELGRVKQLTRGALATGNEVCDEIRIQSFHRVRRLEV